jgi:small subunit ribosomal protein S8
LKQEGFIVEYKTAMQEARKHLNITLKYGRERNAVITGVRRISKPGLRRYSSSVKIPKVVGGMGVAILSTSRGLMTDKEARKSRLGGEILCYVW